MLEWKKYEHFDIACVQHKMYVVLVRWHNTSDFWALHLDELTDAINDLNINRCGKVLMDIRACKVVGNNPGAVSIYFAYRRFWLKNLNVLDIRNNVRIQQLFDTVHDTNTKEIESAIKVIQSSEMETFDIDAVETDKDIINLANTEK